MCKEFTLFDVMIALLVAGLILVSLFSGIFVGPSIAIRALENQGFSNIRIVEKQWFLVSMRGCGQDAVKFTARAVNPAHKEVELFVCVGWFFKGATVRSN